MARRHLSIIMISTRFIASAYRSRRPLDFEISRRVRISVVPVVTLSWRFRFGFEMTAFVDSFIETTKARRAPAYSAARAVGTPTSSSGPSTFSTAGRISLANNSIDFNALA